jgi:isoquinoline 1-oxidoreductase subunit alpha
LENEVFPSLSKFGLFDFDRKPFDFLKIFPPKKGYLSELKFPTAMKKFNLNINGKKRQVNVDPATPLLWVLRDHLQMVGTKYGCGMAMCGACTVHLDGVATRSCSTPVSSIGKKAAITTIEGLSENGDHPVQKAWLEVDVPQCGYCQAGQIMSAAALLKTNPNPTDEEIETFMSGNICRCGTYTRIKKAIHLADSLD